MFVESTADRNSSELTKSDVASNSSEILKDTVRSNALKTDGVTVTAVSSKIEKIALFRSLFKGREDVFPRRFESLKTGKSGYQPACGNEWRDGICHKRHKSKVKCINCDHRQYIPVSDQIIRNHLMGIENLSYNNKDFTMGCYPLLPDETCYFLAADFDKKTWHADVAAFRDTCGSLNIPVSTEISRSGNGAHVWVFFSEPIPAIIARRIGTYALTETMERRPELGLDSYDRFFPNQDTMPKGGFGNLIALPLQRKPRSNGRSVFIDDKFEPYSDQWAFLSTIKKLSYLDAKLISEEATKKGMVIGVKTVSMDEIELENNLEPWKSPPSKHKKDIQIKGELPKELLLVCGNQIYIKKNNLLPPLRNKIIRLAAFQNPEFYKAQAMRMPTFNKPRIISCCEDLPEHIGLPIGCFEELLDLLSSLNINPLIQDERYLGKAIDINFLGALRPEQSLAASALLQHDTGILSASTAFGKTVVASYLIAERAVNTLVLVHRQQLLDQWIARLQTFLNIAPKEIGRIGGGKRQRTGVIDVAIIQSLYKKNEVDDIVADYGHLIVDECHHISAPSFEVVARQCKAKYISGLSATITRKDGHHPIITMQCGPIRYRVNDKVQAQIRPFHHKVIIQKVWTSFPDNLEQSELTINDVYRQLLSDTQRNAMIADDVIKCINNNRSPIILTERKEHLEILNELLSPITNNLIVLKGGMRVKQRREIVDKLHSIPDTEERILLATGKYIGEGFDDARSDTLFLTMPISWKGTIAQYAGRLHRLYDMKREVIIYDYVDSNVRMLQKMYERRLAGYKAIGYEITGNLS